MRIEYINIKPGTILLNKDHNVFKTWFYKLFNKELPYNKYMLTLDDTQIININGILSNITLVEPRREYSRKELELLTRLVFNNKTGEDNKLLPWASDKDFDEKDLFILLNAVRPRTFKADSKLNSFIRNKFYVTKRLKDVGNWNEYIY